MDIDATIRQGASSIASLHVLAFLLAREAARSPGLLHGLHQAFVDQCSASVEKSIEHPHLRERFVAAISTEIDAMFSLASGYLRTMSDRPQR